MFSQSVFFYYTNLKFSLCQTCLFIWSNTDKWKSFQFDSFILYSVCAASILSKHTKYLQTNGLIKFSDSKISQHDQGDYNVLLCFKSLQNTFKSYLCQNAEFRTISTLLGIDGEALIGWVRGPILNRLQYKVRTNPEFY